MLADALARARISSLRLRLGGLPGRLTVLAYHRVCEVGVEDDFPYDPELVSASPADFRWQMQLVQRHFNPISFAALIDSLERGAPLPARALIVSFDDGHRDNYEHAFPVLRGLGIPATIFLSTGYIGARGTFWFDRVAHLLHRTHPGTLSLPGACFSAVLGDVRSRRQAAETLLQCLKRVPNTVRLEILQELERLAPAGPGGGAEKSGAMSWEQVRQMSEAGVEFGSHAVSHPILTALDDAELARELTDSRRTIEEQTGKRCEVLAYPGGSGAYDARVLEAVRASGYRLGVSYLAGINRLRRLERFAIRRLHVERYTSRAYFASLLAFPRVFA